MARSAAVTKKRAGAPGDDRGLALCLAFILGFIIWTAYPMILSAWMSFQEWDILTPPKWNGFANYTKLFFDDNLFWHSLSNTAFLTFLGVPIGMVAALVTALSLNVKTPFTTVFRTLFFLPSQIPGVANAVLWALIFNAQFGILNQLLGHIGIEPINWLFNKDTVKPALIFMGLWGVGGSMMISTWRVYRGFPMKFTKLPRSTAPISGGVCVMSRCL